ncbi:Guanidinobutyrase [Exophiala dermatitidis]
MAPATATRCLTIAAATAAFWSASILTTCSAHSDHGQAELFTHDWESDSNPIFSLNVGPNYAFPLEDLDKDLPFSQPVTFAHLPWHRCFSPSHTSPLDIAIVGFPYDTSTSYRPGARFGPRGIRAASSREKKGRSYNTVWGVDPLTAGNLSIVDCGDIPITPFDAQHAFRQMEQGYRQILWHNTSTSTVNAATGSDSTTSTSSPDSVSAWHHPRILSLGGDHSIVLPILRSLRDVYGPISVIHLDSHLDTWDPYAGYTGIVSNQSAITHGTFFWHAAREGCISKGTSVHAGLRTKLFSPNDYVVDRDVVGFELIEAHEIDELDTGGMSGIVERVRKVVGDTPVYLSIDIDVLDPSIAPATGTPESGGWTTREVKRFIKGLEGVKLVGADVVEVSPPYDTVAEVTSVAASDLLVDIMALMVKDSVGTRGMNAAGVNDSGKKRSDEDGGKDEL